MPNILPMMIASAGAAGGGAANTPFTAYYYGIWGRNSSGQMGQGNTTVLSSPVQIGDHVWNYIQSSDYGESTVHMGGIKTDGTLWMWGQNNKGQLGVGDTTDRCSPVQVGSLTDWRQLGFDGNEGFSTYAIKSDGTIWCWGYGGAANSEGSLGLGAQTTSYSSPVQIGSLTDWGDGEFSIENNQRLGAGVGQMNVIKSDGTMWGWGQNDKGQLSDGSKTARNSPVQAVGGGTAWNIFVTSDEGVCAIDTDGKLWSWGRNGDGQLGLGDTTNYSSPQQIGSAADWVLISGTRSARAAINSSGELYTWAANNDGKLGLGDETSRCVPTQVGSLTDWKYVNISTAGMTAVKTDGTGWAWGNGRETPFDSITNYSSPVQIGSRTDYTWASKLSSGGLIASSATI